MTLAEFIEARLAEDEAAAKAVDDNSEPWRGQWKDDTPILRTYNGWSLALTETPGVVAHMARHDPARVLRQVTAMRAILDLHAPGYPVTYPKPSDQPTCGVCHAGGWDWEPEKWPCPTVRALVAVWADHPDYQQEWKP